MSDSRRRIILVDDNLSNLDQGRSILKTFYEVFPAPSASKMFEILENALPDLILLDIEMPEMNGYEVVKKLKSNDRYSNIPVIFLTSKNDVSSERQGFELGAADYVSKPFSPPILLKRIENQLALVQRAKDLMESREKLREYSENLEELVKQKTDEVINLQGTVIATVADLVEFRDKLTGGHISRTQRYLKILVDKLIEKNIYTDEINEWDINLFLMSVQLHDVGKITISDSILNKPGKLTPEEFEIMKTHVSAGVDAIEGILSNAKEHAFLNHALVIVGTHHERWNGSGYPIGLKGKNIPLEGRLMAIADVYDALVSERSYKKAFPHETACGIIEKGAGKDFDPELVNVFREVEDEFAEVAKRVGAIKN